MTRKKGLYQKYKVERLDGREITKGCFVLELKDAKARVAILAYAAELEKAGEDSELAYDLKAWVGKHQEVDMTPAPREVKQPVSSQEDAMLFDRIVLIKKGQELNEESLYDVPPSEIGEYKNEDDLVLPAVLSVDMAPYNKYYEDLEKKAQEIQEKIDEQNDPLLLFAIEGIKAEFLASEYTDFIRFWNESQERFKKTLKDKYDLVGDKLKNEFQSKSPNQSN